MDNINTLKAKNIHSPHGFSTRTGGVSSGFFESLNLGIKRGDEIENVKENWSRFLESADIHQKEFVCGNQIHSNLVHVASREDLREAYAPGHVYEVDGYVTNERNVPLVVFNADCIPVLLEDYEAKIVSAVHCGWRSTVADIEKNAIDKMLELGASTANIHVAIGPAIEKCCFEVGPEVVDAASKLLGLDAYKSYAVKSRTGEDGIERYKLDLKGVLEARLIQLGIKKENIERVGGCTMCNPKMYFSHRYTGGKRGSLAGVIMLK